MIVVDTNVVSEAMKADPDPNVTDWLDRQAPGSLFLASPSYAEIRLGLELLPAGKRQKAFSEAVSGAIDRLFAGRILPFDHDAAEIYGRIVAAASRKGHQLSVPDAQIAAIATRSGFDVATRDGAFAHTGVRVVNPWR